MIIFLMSLPVYFSFFKNGENNTSHTKKGQSHIPTYVTNLEGENRSNNKDKKNSLMSSLELK